MQQHTENTHRKRVSQLNLTFLLTIRWDFACLGVTARSIERKLHIEQRNQWTRRGSVDKLILMDWTSESVPKNSDGNCKLSILKVIVFVVFESVTLAISR